MADVAARVGVTRKTISRLEKGATSVGIDTFATVLMVLGELHRLSDFTDAAEIITFNGERTGFYRYTR